MNNLFDHRHDGLPPELQAATREFVEWSQARLSVEQNESTPSEPLFHYTGEDALRGILGTQRIWCFSHLHQRDRTEFAYSLSIARRGIKQVGGGQGEQSSTGFRWRLGKVRPREDRGRRPATQARSTGLPASHARPGLIF
jgi:hypothetical protein